MPGIRRFAGLKDLAFKNIKFKQSGLILNTLSNRDTSRAILAALVLSGVDPKDIDLLEGACGAFSAEWLATNKGGRPLEINVSVAICSNAKFKACLRTADPIQMKGFLQTYGLTVLPEKSLDHLREILDGAIPGFGYFIVGKAGNEKAENHAVAYYHKAGGMFFDPNAGEYLFLAAPDEQKTQFFDTWEAAYASSPFIEYVVWGVC